MYAVGILSVESCMCITYERKGL